MEELYDCSLNLTPKVLANSSPGFALKPWDKMRVCLTATLKELRQALPYRDTTFAGFASCVGATLPRVSKQTLG